VLLLKSHALITLPTEICLLFPYRSVRSLVIVYTVVEILRNIAECNSSFTKIMLERFAHGGPYTMRTLVKNIVYMLTVLIHAM
jgi:hypothetical protein